jgi:hypothetical protein
MNRIAWIAAAVAAMGLAACKPQEKAADAAAPGAAPAAGPQGDRFAHMPEKQTLDDMLKRAKDRFDKIDANHDGTIEADELDAAMDAREAAGGPSAGGAPGGALGGGRGGLGALQRADTNGDGDVTWAEAEAQTKERFATTDTNHDGVVTRDEMKAAFAARRSSMGNGGGGGGGGPPRQ